MIVSVCDSQALKMAKPLLRLFLMPKQGNHTGSALNLKSLASSSAHHNTRNDKQNNNLLFVAGPPFRGTAHHSTISGIMFSHFISEIPCENECHRGVCSIKLAILDESQIVCLDVFFSTFLPCPILSLYNNSTFRSSEKFQNG